MPPCTAAPGAAENPVEAVAAVALDRRRTKARITKPATPAKPPITAPPMPLPMPPPIGWDPGAYPGPFIGALGVN